jgi:SulP family sulfate permease
MTPKDTQGSRVPSGRWSFVPKSVTVLAAGYGKDAVIRDLLAGITVGIVALPLAMAFAIASGTTPERGLFTAVVAGFVISAFGGSRYQIGGPTGAFVVIIYNIIAREGYDGLVIATLMAGVLLMVLGFAKIGSLIKFIPYPVTTGFTTGIALLIFSSQIKDFFGLSMGEVPPEFLEKWGAYAEHVGSIDPATLGIGLLTLAIILVLRRFAPKVPGAVAAIVTASAVVALAGLDVETIGTRFGGIPAALPRPSFPAISIQRFRALLPDAVTIALLAGIESLLSAVVADGMTGDRHDSNMELVAEGAANIASVIFGGIPATGAIARTATNIKSGAFSPVAGIVHAAVLLLFVLALAPLASLIPLASLAAVLIVVAWNMSEIEKFVSLLRAPKSDVTVMLLTFLLTLVMDLTVAVQVGVLLAALLFMKRMTDVTRFGAPERVFEDGMDGPVGRSGADTGTDTDAISLRTIPRGVEVYEINGPFFFGVADRLKHVLSEIERPPAVFILRMRHVHAIDATGLNALEIFHKMCRRQRIALVLSGVQPQPAKAIAKMGLDEVIGQENIRKNIDDALARANELLAVRELVKGERQH